MMDNHLWGHKPFSYGQAWIHILMLANHKEGVIWVSQTPIKVARGQLGWSQDRLASEFGWTRQQVRTFLNHLKRDHMINQELHGKMSIITIVNYEKYHGDNQMDNHPVTSRQPAHNQPITTNKNDKNNKKEKKEYISPRLGEHENVRLTKPELDKLNKRFGEDRTKDLIGRLSDYLASKGDKYKSHYATILGWARRDGDRASQPTR
jgi:DNA replication protein DnaD